jgi:CBS domain-containing protein
MQRNVYSVKDKPTGMLMNPFVEVNDATAVRAMVDLIRKDREHAFAQHSGDFLLVKLGTFDDVKGIIGEDDYKPIMEIIDIKESID